MRKASWMMAAAMALGPFGAAAAIEGDGLMLRSDAAQWPRVQGRLSLGTSAPVLRADPMNSDSNAVSLSGASLLGDYYFTRSLHGLGDGGGFRATSGVFVGSRSTTLLSTVPAPGRSFSIDRRSLGSFGLTTPILADAADPAAVPYVGVGYTGLSTKGGWGFSADVGLMALNPGSAVKLGRVFGGTQNLDDVLREMRLSPIVQVGVSYSF
jgi:hypothetical protein